MHNNFEQDKLTAIQYQELLTENDCERILCCDGCAMGYVPQPAKMPSPTMTKHVKDFAGSLRLASLLCANLSAEERRWMCQGLLDISKQIAQEGYLAKFAIYTTEDHRRGCVIGFWPIHLRHTGKFLVPRRFDELVRQNGLPQVTHDPEAA